MVQKETLNDMEELRRVLNDEVEIEKIALDTKKRLIKLCKNRVNEVNSKIEEKEKQIKQIEELIEFIRRDN